MDKSDSISNLAAALSAAQAEFTAVPMNATNPFLHNKYADLGSVIDTAKPVLAKHGLSISQMVTGSEQEVGVTTILMHTSGEWLESDVFLTIGEEKGKSRAQVAGSIVTYLRRYAYSAALGLYADEDTDGNGGTGESGKKATKKPVFKSLNEAKAKLATDLKAQFPEVYPDGHAIGEALKAKELSFTTVGQFNDIKAALVSAAQGE